MKKLGISVYPHHSSMEEVKQYIDMAGKLGFKRVFTCMLSASGKKEDIVNEFTTLCQYAHQYEMEVSVDTNERVFKELGASPYDLSLFKDMGVDIIRLDGHFGEVEDIEITKNQYNIKIEYNSSATVAIDHMLLNGANRFNMCLCANFYPQRYTGMGLERFKQLKEFYRPLGLDNASFVSSQQPHTHGPWKVYEGLPTLEMHRDWPIDVQLRHLIALGYDKDFIVGNAYASYEELESLAKTNLNKISVKVNCFDDISDVEKNIIEFAHHSHRDDCNELVVRSSAPRVAFKGQSIPVRTVEKEYFEVGDVIIVNDNLEHYRGELMIVKQPIKVVPTYNLVGTINTMEQHIVDCILPRYSFELIVA